MCLVKPSACTDEESVYRISIANRGTAAVAIEANKFVDGKEARAIAHIAKNVDEVLANLRVGVPVTHESARARRV